MNEIAFTNRVLPSCCGSGLLASSEPFYHADRIIDFHVLIYVLEGTIYVTEDGIDYVIGSGDLFFLKSGIRHFGKKEIPRGTRWFYCHFHSGEPTADQLSAHLPKKLSGLRESETERRILSFNEYASSDDICKAWLLDLKLAELLTFLVLGESRLSETQSLSRSIAQYLSENISKPFSAAALERRFFLSYKRLAAVFKAETGQTMQQYHDRIKMAEAEKLLCSTMMTVAEISVSVGYSDPLYFSRRFRKLTGKSPTGFRRKAAEQF